VRYPRFSPAELTRRHAALREALDVRGIDELVVYGRGPTAEILYLCEWPGTRESYLLFPLRGEPALLVQLHNHLPNARRTATVADVRWAGASSAESVADALPERGRVGLVGPLPYQHHRAIVERRPGLELVDASDLVTALRLVKSAEELERVRIAAGFTDRAMEALEREVRPGLREDELGAIVEAAYRREGGEVGIHFMATTPMDTPEIGVPSQILSRRVIEAGDVLITEISAAHWGYSGQVHRAYAIGAEPTREYRTLHDVAVEAYERIVAVLRDGATASQVLDAAELIHERGYTVYDDLFHGTSQLPPILQTRQTQRGPFREFTFREGMVVVVQPNVIRDNSARMGLQIGSTLLVTRDGAEDLHRYPMRFVVCAE
jgi:Xaa-Pro aminopeptidase